MTQLEMALVQGDRAMRAAASNAERRIPEFTRRTADYMLAVLTTRGPMSGEQLTDACIAAGYDVAERRAYGASFKRLVKIGGRVVGQCQRTKGHGSSGGKVYGIT